MSETTLRLIAPGALSGAGQIALTRAHFQQSADGRLATATLSGGSRLTNECFGFFGAGGIRAITVSCTTRNPRDVLRVYLGATVTTELRLSGRPQTISLGPGEELAFITEGATVIQLIVEDLAEGQQAALGLEPPPLIRARLSNQAGFSPIGTLNATIPWSDSARMFQASAVGSGALPLDALDPRESRYAGYFWRVRVSGCDGDAYAGAANRQTGDAAFQKLAPGQWSAPVRVSHDDLLAVQSPPVRVGCPAVVADHELLPIDQHALAPAAAPSPLSPPIQPGAIPMAAWTNLSVNAAGATRSEDGWDLWTHAITGNSNVAGNKGFHGAGAGNKAMLGTHAADGLPLGQLTALTIRYGLRTAGNNHILGRPYINLLLDLHGDGTFLKVGVLDPDTNPALNLLVDVAQGDPTDHEYQRSWVGGGKLKIVNELAGVTPAIDLGAGWLNKIFLIADILAVYPAAKLTTAFPADNGLPADLTMPPLWLVLGDSNYLRYSRVIIREVVLA
jgi:hypothetical protein